MAIGHGHSGLSCGAVHGFWTNVIAIFAADLIVWSVDTATAALLGITQIIRNAVHNSVTALALSAVVHGRFAATRPRPKDAIAQLSIAADLAGLAVGFVTTARVMLTVDDRVAAAL